MMGKAHIEHLLHCVRAKAARDTKSAKRDSQTGGKYRDINQHRIALGLECQLIIQQIARGATSAIEVATALGWEPPLVHLGSLETLAMDWLNQRFKGPRD